MGVHVELVVPFVAVEVRRDGRGRGAEFAVFRERIRLGDETPVLRVNLEAVEFVFAEFRNENFPHAGGAYHAHRMAAPVPAIEVADDSDVPGVRRPHGELHAFESLVFDEVRAELAVEFVMRAALDEVAVEIREHVGERVMIDDGILDVVFEADVQTVEERLEFAIERRFEESGVADFYKVENDAGLCRMGGFSLFFRVLPLDFDNFIFNGFGLLLCGKNCLAAYEGRVRLVRAYDGFESAVRFQGMNAEKCERVRTMEFINGIHLFGSKSRKTLQVHCVL